MLTQHLNFSPRYRSEIKIRYRSDWKHQKSCHKTRKLKKVDLKVHFIGLFLHSGGKNFIKSILKDTNRNIIPFLNIIV